MNLPAALFTVCNGDLFQVVFTGHVRSINGSVASPTYSFTGSTTSGMYSGGANILRLATTSANRFQIAANGQTTVNSITPAAGDVFSAYGSGTTLTWAVNGYHTGTDGGGGFFNNTNASNGYNAIEGVTEGTYSGVFGLHIANTGAGYGVYGTTNSPDGIGVYGAWGGSPGWGGLFIGDLGYTGDLYDVSDARFKKDVNTINNALNTISNLNPVQYYYDLQKYPNVGLSDGKSFGFIADELELVIPELVKEKKIDLNGTKPHKAKSESDADMQKFKTVNYISLIPILTKAIQEQQQKIEELEKRIEEQDVRLKALETK